MEITDIKSHLTLARVLQHYNLKPDKNLRLHCPFHEDKTPSLQVYYKTHTCYCFSSNCKTHGKSLDVTGLFTAKRFRRFKNRSRLQYGTVPSWQQKRRCIDKQLRCSWFISSLGNEYKTGRTGI